MRGYPSALMKSGTSEPLVPCAGVKVVISALLPSGETEMLPSRSACGIHTTGRRRASVALRWAACSESCSSSSRITSNSCRCWSARAPRWPLAASGSRGALPLRMSVSWRVSPVASSKAKALPSRTKNTSRSSRENFTSPSKLLVCVMRRCETLPRVRLRSHRSPLAENTSRVPALLRRPVASSGATESMCASLTSSGAAPARAATRYDLRSAFHLAPGSSQRK